MNLSYNDLVANFRQNLRSSRARLYYLLLTLGLVLLSCGLPDRRIGIPLELSGAAASLGVACHNGIEMAVLDLERQGRGHYELIDLDLGSSTTETARNIDRLWQEGIRIFVGAYTSAQAQVIMEYLKDKDGFLISPTAASTWFSGRTDNFYRLIVGTDQMAEGICQLLQSHRSQDRVLVVEDSDNQSYTKSFGDWVERKILALGGHVTRISYPSSGKPDFRSLLLQARVPDSCVLLCNSLDAGLIAQAVRNLGYGSLLVACPWAMAPDALQTGGLAAEGMIFISPSGEEGQQPLYADFAARYRLRYGKDPGFAAVQGWEAMMALDTILSKAGSRVVDINRWLGQPQTLSGLEGSFVMDSHGDVHRPVFWYRVIDRNITYQGRIGVP